MAFKKRKGQLTIIGLISVFLLIIVFIALQPAINRVIQVAQNATNDSTEDLLLGLIPLIIIAMLISSIVLYLTPTFVRTYAGG